MIDASWEKLSILFVYKQRLDRTNLRFGDSQISQHTYAVTKSSSGTFEERTCRVGETCQIFHPRTHVVQAIDPLGNSSLFHLRHPSGYLRDEVQCQSWCKVGEVLTELNDEGTRVSWNKAGCHVGVVSETISLWRECVTCGCDDGTLVVFDVRADSSQKTVCSTAQFLIFVVDIQHSYMKQGGRHIREPRKSFGQRCLHVFQLTFSGAYVLSKQLIRKVKEKRCARTYFDNIIPRGRRKVHSSTLTTSSNDEFIGVFSGRNAVRVADVHQRNYLRKLARKRRRN